MWGRQNLTVNGLIGHQITICRVSKSMTTVIDGKAAAAALRADLALKVADLKRDHGLTPGLAVVLVGEDPASQVYVRNKAKQTVEVGMESIEHKLPADTKEADLLALSLIHI